MKKGAVWGGGHQKELVGRWSSKGSWWGGGHKRDLVGM